MTTETVLTDSTLDAVDEAICGALGDAYDCMRVWSAWGYGAMGPDDFSLTAENSERVREISEAAIQTVLQSPEIQNLSKDAERYRWIRRDKTDAQERQMVEIVRDNCEEYFDVAIDAAMEQQP